MISLFDGKGKIETISKEITERGDYTRSSSWYDVGN
jgi:hypothetical protein